MVGDEMRRGISGGEKRRLTTGMGKNDEKVVSYSRELSLLLLLSISCFFNAQALALISWMQVRCW